MNADASRRLEELLDREIDAAHVLETTLAAERSALTGAEPAAVERLAAEKIRLFAELEALENERRALWQPTAEHAPPPRAVAERWTALLAAMAACRTANDLNGHIIHARQHQVRQLLDAVRGVKSLTYGPRGQTHAAAPRALARV